MDEATSTSDSRVTDLGGGGDADASIVYPVPSQPSQHQPSPAKTSKTKSYLSRKSSLDTTAIEQHQQFSMEPPYQHRNETAVLVSGDEQCAMPVPPPKKPHHEKTGSCKSLLATLFGTRMLISKYDREDYVRTTLIELIVYIIYLIVTCTLTYGITVSNSFYFTNAISNLFLNTPFGPNNPTTFRTSNTIEDFWAFTDTVLPHGLHWNYWYGTNSPSHELPPKERGVLYENRLIGLPRLRQLRVKEQQCPISDKFDRLFRKCYPPYSRKHEEKNDFDASLAASPQLGTAWRYYTQDQLEGTYHWGRLATYSGGGAYQLLGVDAAGVLQNIIPLRNHRWITRATRVIFLDFTVFNANTNLFCIVTLVWEFPVTGGVVTSWSIRTVKLDRYHTVHEYFMLAFEVLFMLFTLYYTIQELIEMFASKCSEYWSEFWTYLDISILLISYACIGFGFYRYFHALNTVEDLIKDDMKYANFYWLGFWEAQFNNSVAILVFLIWIKVFKYISFNRTMSQLSSTMSRCSKDVGGFAIMFFIVFFAFAQLGYLLFGSTVDDFRTFHDTTYALLRLILGDFNFRAIEAANRVLGPLFFITYVFFVFFVLLNMFLAIINDTYSEVKAELKGHGDEFQLSDYLKRGVNNVFGICGCKSKQVEAEGKAKLANTENVITNEELRENLAKSNYSEVEVEMFLTRYELDEERTLDVDEAENVLGGLEGYHPVGGKAEIIGAEGPLEPSGFRPPRSEAQALTDTEISELQSRVGILESSLTGITRKMDLLIGKLDMIDAGRPSMISSRPTESHF